MRKKLRIMGLLFALAALLCAASAALAQSPPEATPEPDEYAVVVGDMRFPKELVQFTLKNYIYAFIANGTVPTEEEAQMLLDETVEHYVQLGVIDSKLKKERLYDFSEEDLAYYRSYAQQIYEQFWQSAFDQLSAEYGEDITEEQVSEWMNQTGFTVEMFYQDTLASARMGIAIEKYCAGVTVTTQEIVDYYMENFVEPDREKYENDVKRYEEEILLRGNEAFFTPEGYRYMKHILLPFPDEVQEEIDAVSARIKEAEARRQEAYDALAEAAAGGEDIAPYKATYDERMAALTALGEEYEAAVRSAVPLLKQKTDEILRRYKAGESFETLMTDYSTDSQHQKESDPGYLFHPDSENWAGAFRNAAAALSKPGDVSQPFATTEGVHIVCYMSDAPCGIHKLTEQEQQALNASALQSKRLDALAALIEEWKADYAVETHPEMLDASVPEIPG